MADDLDMIAYFFYHLKKVRLVKEKYPLFITAHVFWFECKLDNLAPSVTISYRNLSCFPTLISVDVNYLGNFTIQKLLCPNVNKSNNLILHRKVCTEILRLKYFNDISNNM